MTSELKSTIEWYKNLEVAWKSSVKNTDEYLAATCLFEHFSYRLLETAKEDPLIGLRVLLRTAKRIFRPEKGAVKNYENEGSALVISGTIVIQERVTQYVRRSSHARLHSYMAKDVIPHQSAKPWVTLLTLLPFALRQAIRCIVSPMRANLALTISSVVEIAFVIEYIKLHKIETVYDFVPFEVDSNFMYLMLRERGVRVVKIPSSGPLSTHHRILIADDVVFSTPYHFEELSKFKETMRVQKVLQWPPERAFQYFSRYKENRPIAEKNTLGFYSHGEWLRIEEKHSAYGGKIGEAEATILKYLGQYTIENPSFRLRIFPHPREMRPDVKERMMAFYKKAIGHENFEIMLADGGTTMNFEKVDIAIAAFSTILYERLFCGYKTLIGNMAISEFPMNRSMLNSICFSNYEHMSQLIHHCSTETDDLFFEKTGLDTFRAKHYPEP